MKNGSWLWTLAIVLLITPAAAAQVETEPLYRYKSTQNNFLFTTSSALPPGLSGSWTRELVVCHVPKPSAGTRPIYQLSKSDNLGERYAYTKSETESGGGWHRDPTPAFHVATEKRPGTAPLYRLYAPLRTVGDPDGFSGPVPGTDTHFYTTSGAERKEAIAAGWVSQGWLGYVWTSPQALPDLIIQKAEATERSVTALVRNVGKKNTGGSSYNAVLTVYRSDGSVLNTFQQPGPGVSPNQVTPIVFNTGSTDLTRLRYRVTVDDANSIAESNEGNNQTSMLEGPKRTINIKPSDKPPAPPKPSFRVVGTKKEPNGRARYTLKITNVDAFPADWFVPAGPALPPNPCGDARMLANVYISQNGKRTRVHCKPLGTRNALQTVEFIAPAPLTAGEMIELVLEDRLLNQQFASAPYDGGWIGVSDLLGSAGCQHFLGRESSYLCDATGFAACENLRKSGKPIQCTQKGKKK